MKTTLLAAAAVAAMAIPGAAFAQSETAVDLSGFYVGVGVALSEADDGINDQIYFDPQRNGTYTPQLATASGANAFSPGFCQGYGTVSPANGCKNESAKREISVRAGYDGMVGSNIVAGLLGEYAFHGPTDAVTAFSTTPASYTIARKMDGVAAMRGRLGYSPNGMGGFFYVTGGLAYGKMKHAFSTNNTANTCTPVDADKWQLGGQVGGGVEIMHRSGVAVNLEYLYNRFRDNDYYVAVGQGSAPATNPFVLGGGTNMRMSTQNFDYHTFMVGLSYK